MTKTPTNKPVIGLVGGIGAGKSIAAAELVALGCRLIDADAIGHALLDEPDVQSELKNRWGEDIFDSQGRVNRAAVGKIVFADRAELEAINAVMHPRMRRRMEREIAKAKSAPAVEAVVLDAAVLFEAGWDDLCTCVIFVDAPEDVRLRRLSSRPGWNAAKSASIEKFQISLDKKAAMCDYTIGNSSSVSHLRKQVGELFREIFHSAD